MVVTDRVDASELKVELHELLLEAEVDVGRPWRHATVVTGIRVNGYFGLGRRT